mmetsp:Transcript_56572/g.106131  ORF Transcript_56572/g.106131 Transcript_56572/m.106131 type:complete len:231 (-) Transcript_56572:23-715(-)
MWWWWCRCCKHDDWDSDFLHAESIHAQCGEHDRVDISLFKKRQELAQLQVDREDAPFVEMEAESFEIEVWKMAADNFGLELDLTNPSMPIIACLVPDSQAARWNYRAPPAMQLLPGLGLRSVNDVSEDAGQISAELLQRQGKTSLGFRWPSLQTVKVDLSGKPKPELKMVLPQNEAAGVYLEKVDGVSTAGLKAGMHVRAVDGRRGTTARMKQEIEEATSTLTLLVACYT